MLRILDIHREIVPGGMVAVVRPPISTAHLLVFGPSIECTQCEVVQDKTFARSDEIFNRGIGAVSPAILSAPIVVIHYDQIVWRQSLRSCSPEFFVTRTSKRPVP